MKIRDSSSLESNDVIIMIDGKQKKNKEIIKDNKKIKNTNKRKEERKDIWKEDEDEDEGEDEEKEEEEEEEI